MRAVSFACLTLLLSMGPAFADPTDPNHQQAESEVKYNSIHRRWVRSQLRVAHNVARNLLRDPAFAAAAQNTLKTGSPNGEGAAPALSECQDTVATGVTVPSEFGSLFLGEVWPHGARLHRIGMLPLTDSSSARTAVATPLRGGKIRFNQKHKGLRKSLPSSQLTGTLLNTMVHEMTHLARKGALGLSPAGGFVILDQHKDQKGEDPRPDYAACRARIVSYNLGNLAQCYVWSTGESAPAEALADCWSTDLETWGTTTHKPSAGPLDISSWR